MGFFPWKRGYINVKDGVWDTAAVWGHTKERESLFLFPTPVVQIEWVFFHRKDLKFDWEKISDLKKYNLGITSEYDYNQLTRAINAKKIKANGILDKILKDFDTGKYDKQKEKWKK